MSLECQARNVPPSQSPVIGHGDVISTHYILNITIYLHNIYTAHYNILHIKISPRGAGTGGTNKI